MKSFTPNYATGQFFLTTLFASLFCTWSCCSQFIGVVMNFEIGSRDPVPATNH